MILTLIGTNFHVFQLCMSWNFHFFTMQEKKQEILRNKIQTRSRAHDIIRNMLASLADPYTRFLSPSEVRCFIFISIFLCNWRMSACPFFLWWRSKFVISWHELYQNLSAQLDLSDMDLLKRYLIKFQNSNPSVKSSYHYVPEQLEAILYSWP